MSVSRARHVTHVEAADGRGGLIGLHHLGQRPHLLDAGRHGLGVRETLRTDGHSRSDGRMIPLTVSPH